MKKMLKNFGLAIALAMYSQAVFATCLTTTNVTTAVTGGAGQVVFSNDGDCLVVSGSGSINTTGIYDSAVRVTAGGGNAYSVTNAGTMTGFRQASGIDNGVDSVFTLNNTGTIQGGQAFHNFQATSSIVNSGSLIGTGDHTVDPSLGFGIFNNMQNSPASTSTFTSITNTGSIVGATGSYGIGNQGVITTLNNLQGAGNVNGALTYTGILPTNYNIIISSPSSFGKLAVTSGTGSMAFGIYNTSIVAAGTYLSVVTGTNSITSTSGTFGGLNWTLVNSSGTIWDLVFALAGPSAADTQSSLHSLAPKLRGGFSSQAIATNFANMNTYDCDLFDAKGVCVSVGGQQTYVDNPSSNMTSTVVVAGYKVSPQIRIGGFLNQNINNNTVAGVHISNANPMMGLFAVWNQNEDRLGYQVKIANAYQDKDVTTTRDVIGTSEAGTGSTTLNTQSYVGELSYAFLANDDKTLVRPYAALRYTRIKQDGYTEQTSAGVRAPLTYSALADSSTAVLVGVKLNHKLAEKVNLTGSLGIEQDLHHQVDNLTATGLAGLTSENFNDSIKRTRPVASIGAYYMPVKNQRIAADLYYQQMPFQSTASTTAYVNYTIGF